MSDKVSTRGATSLSSVVLACALAGLPLGAPRAEPPVHHVTLDDGRVLEGLLVPAAATEWILQSEDLCLLLGPERIKNVDGKAGPPPPVAGESPLLRNDIYEEILPGGDVVARSVFERDHRGPGVLRTIEWDIDAADVERLRDWKVFDSFGAELAVEISDREGGGRHARAALPRPIVEGEALRVSNRVLFRDAVLRDEDGTFRWNNGGGYPDDRLVTHFVRLPRGAKIVSVEPPPLEILEQEGSSCVVWRRYYQASEQHLLEVRFREDGVP